MTKAMTLLEMLDVVRTFVQQPATQNVWVTAEVQDVQVRGGHCYMEMLQKDDAGRQQARVRGCIWASNYARIARSFYNATGQQSVFGISLVINEVNPEFTMGDLLRRRNEILRRLQAEGVLEMNRQLRWPLVPQRIAVVSAPGAAGYGDFINQLYTNPSHLRFTTRLYPAVMQGASAPQSVIAALMAVADDAPLWDGVVIIRGGGATSDLQAFEDYELAATVAQFPLPVAIGIGHERDVTVLDYVANARLKTPTAVAEWLIGCGESVLGAVNNLGARILQAATDRISGNRQQLAQATGLLPALARGAVERARARLGNATGLLSGVSGRLIHPQLERLGMTGRALATATATQLQRRRDSIDAAERLLAALSPQATLLRGYSITRVGGKAITSPDDIPAGTILETTLASGTLLSVKK